MNNSVIICICSMLNYSALVMHIWFFSFLPSSPKEASVEVFTLRAAASENPAVVRAEVGLCGTRLCLLLSQVRCCICLKRESILMRLLLSLEQRFFVRIIVLQFSAYFEYSKSFSDSWCFLFLYYTSIELCDLTTLIYSFRIYWKQSCLPFASPESSSL